MEIIAVERGLSSFSSHRRSRPFLVSERRHNSSFRLTRLPIQRAARPPPINRSPRRRQSPSDGRRGGRQMRDGSDTALTDRPPDQWFRDFLH